jgi:hypothetical protein
MRITAHTPDKRIVELDFQVDELAQLDYLPYLPLVNHVRETIKHLMVIVTHTQTDNLIVFSNHDGTVAHNNQ